MMATYVYQIVIACTNAANIVKQRCAPASLVCAHYKHGFLKDSNALELWTPLLHPGIPIPLVLS